MCSYNSLGCQCNKHILYAFIFIRKVAIMVRAGGTGAKGLQNLKLSSQGKISLNISFLYIIPQKNMHLLFAETFSLVINHKNIQHFYIFYTYIYH